MPITLLQAILHRPTQTMVIAAFNRERLELFQSLSASGGTIMICIYIKMVQNTNFSLYVLIFSLSITNGIPSGLFSIFYVAVQVLIHQNKNTDQSDTAM